MKRKKQIPIILQTPKLYLPFGLSKAYQSNDKYTLNLTFESESIQNGIKSKVKDFRELIGDLDNYFQSGFEHYSYYPSLRQNEDKFYPPYLRAKISPLVPLQVFDIYENKQDLDYIVPGSWATCLLYLKHVWVNQQDHLVGLSWYVLQCKVKTPVPILNRCLIDDDWSSETLCSICHAKVVKKKCVQGVVEPIPEGYEKYFKMLSLGIPILPVIQRCQMDEMDPEVIISRHANRPQGSSDSKEIRPIPKISLSMPPKLPRPKAKQSGSPRIVFSVQDLLKTKENLGKKQFKPAKQSKVLTLNKRDPRVPSLEMILRSRKKLKKVPYQKIINNCVVPNSPKYK